MTVAEQDAKAVAEGNYMNHSKRWVGPNTDRRAHRPLSSFANPVVVASKIMFARKQRPGHAADEATEPLDAAPARRSRA